MKDLMNINKMTGLTTVAIAELTGKRHDNVLRDTRTMLTELYGEGGLLRFEESYKNDQNKEQPCYLLPKEEVLILVSGYSIPLRAKIIRRLEELETIRQKSLSPMEVIVQMAQKCLEQERQMKVLEQQQNIQSEKLLEIESKVRTSDYDYYSVSGFANLRGFKNLDLNKAKLIGMMASKLSKEYGMDIGKVPDARFGSVGTYHLDILVEAFKRHGLN